MSVLCFFSVHGHHRDLHVLTPACPTRRSFDRPGGSATRAAIQGNVVAGKTGTARKLSDTGVYDPKRHQALFVGMVPAENPRLVGLVIIDEPGDGRYYGGLAAAPVFSRVMQGAARLLQISPDGTHTPDLAPPSIPRSAGQIGRAAGRDK